MKLKLTKFFQTSVKYLGHIIDANGLHPTTDKVTAVVKATRHKNVMELKSYLDLLNYLSITLQPFYYIKEKSGPGQQNVKKLSNGANKR